MNTPNSSLKLKTKDFLSAPIAYWSNNKSFKNNTDSCGGNDLTSLLVPDSLLGINITKACSIHDYMYEQGGTKKDRKLADSLFLNNMTSLIKNNGKSVILKPLRKFMAHLYYKSVDLFGKSYFKSNKED